MFLKETKICKKCNEELPATSIYFVKEKRSKSGISSLCKKCKMEIDKQYRITHKKEIAEYKSMNKEKIKENQKIYINKVQNNGIQKKKKCTKCGRLLPIVEEYFGTLKSSKDGFRYVCKECRKKEYNTSIEYKNYKKKYYQEHKEKI